MIIVMPVTTMIITMKLRLTRPGITVQESVIPKQQQYRLVLVYTWWYWVSIEWHWLVLGGAGSEEGGTG